MLEEFIRNLRPVRKIIELSEKVARLDLEVQNIRAALDAFITDPDIVDVSLQNVLMTREFLAKLAARKPRPVVLPKRSGPALSIDEAFEILEKKAPEAFALWKERLSINEETYEGFPDHSCSYGAHEKAAQFGRFLLPYRYGTVLDIGCGPQPVPSYLGDHPAEHICGVDPLSDEKDHPFTFVKGFAEFLPWEDESFDLVICGTSLDHVFLLDDALAEMHRVLKPDGHLVCWVSFITGAAPYDPFDKRIEAVDRFHLFHFDRPWFREVLSRRFTAVEWIETIAGTRHCFASFAKKPRA